MENTDILCFSYVVSNDPFHLCVTQRHAVRSPILVHCLVSLLPYQVRPTYADLRTQSSHSGGVRLIQKKRHIPENTVASLILSKGGRLYLAMVCAAVLGHGTLAVHQEAVPATLLGQSRLVALGDEGVQLTLLTADGLHKLGRETRQNEGLAMRITQAATLLISPLVRYSLFSSQGADKGLDTLYYV